MQLLPQNNSWVQTNRSDILGNLWGSFNLDLTTILGKTKITRTITTTTGLNSVPCGFKVYNNILWTVAGNTVYKNTSNTTQTPFSVAGGSGVPSQTLSYISDIEVFNGNMYVTESNSNDFLYQFNGSTWSHVTLSGASTGPHMMTVFNGRLYITIGATSKIYSTPDGTTITSSSNYSLTLDSTYTPTFIKASNNKIWIGTIASSGKGYVYEWDGVSTSPTRAYRLEAQGAISCVIKDDVPWIVDTNGRLLVYSNGTFIEKSRFNIKNKLFIFTISNINNRFVHPNGMAIINGKINILINNQVQDGTIFENCPSGIWEYDETIGLYHKYGFSYLPTGTDTITDYGQNRISIAGALVEVKNSDNSDTATGDFLAGATIYTDVSTTSSCIFTNDTFLNITGLAGQHNTIGNGYLVTNKIYADDSGPYHLPSVQNIWQNIYTTYKALQNHSSTILVKYRVIDQQPLEASITWTSNNTFTTTTNVLGLEGYEVEGIQGTGSGYTAQIVSIINNSGTYTVTLDDNFDGVTGTAKVRIQNWKKISTINTSSPATYDQAGIGSLSNWVQFKIGLKFMSQDELERLIIINQNANPAN